MKSYRTLIHPLIIRLKCHINSCSDELFITTGASFGVTLVSTALFEAGDMAFVADPTYFLVFDILKMGKLNLTCTYVQSGFTTVYIKLHVHISTSLYRRTWYNTSSPGGGYCSTDH